MGFGAEEIRIPQAKQRQNDRQILFQWRGLEMNIHRPRAGEQTIEFIHADGQRRRQAHGRPQ